jgi:hypothetical protein
MYKLQPTGQNLGRVFNFRFGHLHAEHFWCYQVKLPNLKLKTRPKQLQVSLPLVIALPGLTKHCCLASILEFMITIHYII